MVIKIGKFCYSTKSLLAIDIDSTQNLISLIKCIFQKNLKKACFMSQLDNLLNFKKKVSCTMNLPLIILN